MDNLPGVRRVLHQAQLHGYLLARYGTLYHPSGQPSSLRRADFKGVCPIRLIEISRGRCKITQEGLRVLASATSDPAENADDLNA